MKIFCVECHDFGDLFDFLRIKLCSLLHFRSLSFLFEYFFASRFRISGDILAGSYYYFRMGIFFPGLEPVGRFQKAQRFPTPACFT